MGKGSSEGATRTLREGRKGSPPVYGGPGEWGELWVMVGFRCARGGFARPPTEQAYQRLQKAAIQRSAEGAAQVQRVLGGRLPVADSAI